MKTILKHKHKMKLTMAGKKGYTFTCSIEPCQRQFSVGKLTFWSALGHIRDQPLVNRDWETPLGFPKSAYDG